MKRFGLRSEKRSAGKVITAALVGSVVGATVGLLMAPSSGRELRRRIQDEVMGPGGAYETVQMAARDGGNRARELAAQAKDQVNEMKGAVSHRRQETTSRMPEVEG